MGKVIVGQVSFVSDMAASSVSIAMALLMFVLVAVVCFPTDVRLVADMFETIGGRVIDV